MATSSIQPILRMNNRACLAIQRGKDEQSVVALLTQCLSRLKEHVTMRLTNLPPNQRTNHHPSPSNCNKHGDGDVLIIRDNVFVQVRALSTSSASRLTKGEGTTTKRHQLRDDEWEPNSHYIFDKAIAIVLPSSFPSDCDNSSSSNNDSNIISEQTAITMYSACILMNMAIVHHRWAIQSIEQSTASSTTAMYFTKAKQLYTMILKTLTTNNLCPTSSAFCVIALNNLADIHSRSGTVVGETSNYYGGQLAHFIGLYRRSCISMNATPSLLSASSPLVTLLTKSDLDKMTLNVMVWTRSDQLAPAA